MRADKSGNSGNEYLHSSSEIPAGDVDICKFSKSADSVASVGDGSGSGYSLSSPNDRFRYNIMLLSSYSLIMSESISKNRYLCQSATLAKITYLTSIGAKSWLQSTRYSTSSPNKFFPVFSMANKPST